MRAVVANTVAGAGLAGAVSALGMALIVFLGLTSGASVLVFVAGAAGGAVFGLLGSPDGSAQQATGAAAIGAMAIITGVLGSFGWLEAVTILCSLAMAVLVGTGAMSRLRLPGWWWTPIVVLTILMIIPLLLDGGALGHDESAYAVKAKTWLYGTPVSGWGIHRGVGVSAYAVPVLSIGGSEPALRALGLVSLAVLAYTTWLLSTGMGDKAAGAVAVLAVLASPPMLRRATEYLSDIPSAAMLMVVMLIVWRQFGAKAAPDYGLVAMIPFALLAFYLRYQSVLSFALIAVAIALLWRRKVVARPGPVIVSGVLGLAGLVPHFFFAVSSTGSPWGILTYTATTGGRDFTGDGLIDYLAIMGWGLALLVGPILMLIAGWWLVARWRDAAQRTRAIFLLLPASLQVMILGTAGGAEPRFVFFPFALLAVAGGLGLRELLRGRSSEAIRATTLGFAVLLIGTMSLSLASSRRWVDGRSVRYEPLILASEELRENAGSAECSVMTSYLPQITFYSECVTDRFRTELDPEVAIERLPGEYTFMLLVEDGKRQPEGEELESLVDHASAGPDRVEGDAFWADLYRFAP